jgi:GNAT superfamily N-acetyltransferase
MQIRTIRWPQDRPAIIDHMRLVHGADASDMLGNWYGSMVDFNPEDCFVIDGENDQIAAHTMVIPRFLHFGESIIQAGEIGIGGTLETYREQGYASALMQRSIERMTERGDAVSIIFGIPNFYERWGYEYGIGVYLTGFESYIETELALKANKWDFLHSHDRRLAAWLGIRQKEIVVRSFDLADLPAVMELYNQSAVRGHYVMARDEATWQWQLGYMEANGRYQSGEFLVAEHNNQIVAYLRMATDSHVNWFNPESSRFAIIESAGNDPDAIEALLAEVAVCAHDYNAQRIGLYIHPESTLMRHVLAHGAVMRSYSGAGFLRLNDLTLLLESMLSTFQRRLSHSPFATDAIRLRVSSEEQSAEISFGALHGMEEEIVLEAPSTDLMRLFSGWYGIDNLSAEGYSERHYERLKALFPKGDPKIGIADLI